MKRFLMAVALTAVAASPALADAALKVDTSKSCSFVIKLRPDLAPKHVAQVTKIAAAGQYDGVVFHRVIDGFMAQTGDVKFGKDGGDLSQAGMGGSDEPNIPAEFNKEHFKRGTVGMARSNEPDSANSQFFVMFADGGFLDGKYTVFGEVDAEGMKCVDMLTKGDSNNNGSVAKPDKMTKVTVIQ
ncbi:peptidylprolyl isomerase [Aestuariivirga litoralis]|uniref:peptidylprolyl isomerase n=1 Tax=Aestuariivirga litoralis TaxID=2650924 RepID=UPI0018C4AEDC|nr:peptidylprolyl isomerase [Aestuariivirga litoralis]MBG1231412.1 peptidylprolyl isomerase [Aestuariivirga litoralis]